MPVFPELGDPRLNTHKHNISCPQAHVCKPHAFLSVSSHNSDVHSPMHLGLFLQCSNACGSVSSNNKGLHALCTCLCIFTPDWPA